jgi:hypothetical protein
MKYISFFAAVAMLAMSACHSNDEPEWIKDVTNTEETDYDFSPELADSEARYVSSTLELRYNSGGVLVSRVADSGRSVLRIVELATGRVVEFSCADTVAEGELSDVVLTVDGEAVTISQTIARKVNETGAWIEILAPGDKHYVLVITDI